MPRGNLQYARDFNPYAKDVTLEELQKVRRQLAKVMNQRIVRLRDTKSPITGEAYTFGAYDVMMDYLGNRDRNRFSEVLKPSNMSKSDIQKEIRVLQGFEDMKSSRVAGMHEIEAARINTFISEKGMSKEVVTNKEFYDFLNSATYDELMTGGFDSDKIQEEYNLSSERGLSHKQIVKAMTEYSREAKRFSIKGLHKKLGAIKIKGKKRKK